jgi:hypothetical protein
MIRITSRVDGFRRCGVAHSKVATDHPDAAFSKKQLAELQNEPMLTVEVIADEPKTGGKQADKTAGKKSEQGGKGE